MADETNELLKAQASIENAKAFEDFCEESIA